jgi:hypothetical protein
VPQARLRIFGETPPGNELYRASCLQLIRDLGLRGTAVLEGRVESQVEAYHAGTMVALTSISEGFPYSVVEAMACGRAVVCTNVGGVAEAVADAGLVVPARDHVAVADACVRLLRDHELRRRMSSAARDRVLNLFTLGHSLNAYRQVYQRLMDESPIARLAPAPQPKLPGRRAEPRPTVRGRVHLAVRGTARVTARGRVPLRVRATAPVAAGTVADVMAPGSADEDAA